LRLEADFYQIRPLIDALNLATPVALNVGGVPYTTSLSILTKYPDSALGRMFSGGLPISKDEDGAYRIERNGRLFGFILDFLRSNELGLPDDFQELELLKEEADFYQIAPMIEALKKADGVIVEIEELEFTPVDPLAPIRDLQFELTITAPVSFFGCMETVLSPEGLVRLSECPFYLRYKFSDSYLALLGTDRRCYFDMWVLDHRPNNESLVRVRYHSNYIASYSGTSRFALEDLLRRKGCRIRHTSSAADSNGRITHNRWFVPRSFLSNCQNLQYQL